MSMKRQLLLAFLAAALGGVSVAQPRSASEPQKLIGANIGLMAPVWSPKGDKIAVTTNGYTGVFVADANGENLKCVTDASGAGYKMQWSADGKHILGRTNIVKNNRMFHEVKVWNVENVSERTLVRETRDLKGTPTWKAVDRVNVKENTGVRTMSMSGVAVATVQNAYDIMVNDPVGAMSEIAGLSAIGGKMVLNPSLSTDGEKIAFQIYGKGMFVCNVDGTAVKSIGKGVYPTWLPDNETVVFNLTSDNGSRLTASSLNAINVKSGKSVVLVNKSDIIPLKPTVSPDGTKVAFENVADESIYVVNLKY